MSQPYPTYSPPPTSASRLVRLDLVEEAMERHLDDPSGLTNAMLDLSEQAQDPPTDLSDLDRPVEPARPPLAFSVRIKRPWVEEDLVWPRSTYGVDPAGVLFVFHDDGTNHAYSPSRWAEANTEMPEEGQA